MSIRPPDPADWALHDEEALATVESRVQRVFEKIGLADDPGTNRKVLATLTALGS